MSLEAPLPNPSAARLSHCVCEFFFSYLEGTIFFSCREQNLKKMKHHHKTKIYCNHFKNIFENKCGNVSFGGLGLRNISYVKLGAQWEEKQL